MRHIAPWLIASLLVLPNAAGAEERKVDGNRLAYLDHVDPWYPHRDFAKLITPQWVGEEGVEAVVILGIDDMRGHEKWEAYLRPILERLKKIDGRAPVSIMTCDIDPNEPHLQTWLKEGLSLECHTVDHPCPLLGGGDFNKAKSTYDRCVDKMFSIPGNRPVAFRTPCCDSLNTVSPRFFAEIFSKTTGEGKFLTIDSSVFCLLTPNDPTLPRELVLEQDGTDRFRKYLPADRTFVNYIEDYPYPYVIGNTCWEFPCMVPSDWAAQHLHQPNNPKTVEDWKAALDCVVIKQGVFCLVFHPHGWIRPEQVIEFIDHAVAKHGKKVKFLTFKEAEERLQKIGASPLRHESGKEYSIRILDLNNDGFMDVASLGDAHTQWFSTWLPKELKWEEMPEPPLVPDARYYAAYPRGPGVVVRDIDGDGALELIFGLPKDRAAFSINIEANKLPDPKKLPFGLPEGAYFVDDKGRDAGLRLVDLDDDGDLDVIFSNEKEYGLYLFESMESGWSRKIFAGQRGEGPAELPPFVQDGTNMGAFFHSRHLFLQNEHTSEMKDLVYRRSFNDLLSSVTPAPKSPEQSLRSLKPRPGFQVELVAAEPLVMDPVAFEWGPDGKLWVVEMADYPLGLDDKGQPGGRVKYLEDTDGDGKYDKATLLLDGLSFPSDVMPWRSGVLITAAPHVLYAEDCDADGKADLIKPLYAGFTEGNQQHRVNGFRWGLDNWIYLANGDSGGKVKPVGQVFNLSAEEDEKRRVTNPSYREEVELGGRDLRIRPDTGEIDLATGKTQHGRCRDDWGDWFGANNSNPAWHFALTDHYLRRNPHATYPPAAVDLTDNRYIYPLSRPISHWEGYRPPPAGEPGKITADCGNTIYRDDLFGEAYRGNMFMSETVHNLVHRMVLEPQGASWRARRAADEQTSEFLASTDSWFRPNTLKTGPDGALYVADMYRLVIEHPEWIDDNEEKRLDLRQGHDKGRIYRVFPVGTKPRQIPRLDKLSTPELVAALDSSSGWQRDTIQQMLLWRGDEAAIEPLRKLARECQNPLARLHAFCTLDGLGAFTAEDVAAGCKDEHPGVRRNAVRIAEPLFHPNEVADAGLLLPLVDDADPQVRLQLAYTLGKLSDPKAGEALARLTAKDAADPYIMAAISSSAPPHVEAMSKAASRDNQNLKLFVDVLTLALSAGDEAAVARMIAPLADASAGDAARFIRMAGVLTALDRRAESLSELRRTSGRELRDVIKRLDPLFESARTVAADDDAELDLRTAAIPLLCHTDGKHERDRNLLSDLLKPRHPLELQLAALSRLGKIHYYPDMPSALLQRWDTYTPRLKSAVLASALERSISAFALLDCIDSGTIAANELNASERDRLLSHPDEAIRRRAEQLLGRPDDSSRQEIIDKYATALTKHGDLTRGAAAFKQHCAKCHKLGDEGRVVGPDLKSLTDRSSKALLAAVLDPNRAVEAKYRVYSVELADGRVLTGVLAEETGGGIRLLDGDKQHDIPRGEIVAMQAGQKSLMPEGIEKDLTIEQMADLLEFLSNALK